MQTKKTFRFRLLLIYLISTFIPLLMITVVGTAFYQNSYRKEIINVTTNTLYSMSLNIEYYLRELENLTIIPYNYNQVTNYMKYLSKPTPDVSLVTMYSMEQGYSSAMCKAINIPRSNVTGILFVPLGKNASSKAYMITKNSADLETFFDADILNQKWLNDTISQKGKAAFLVTEKLNYRPTLNRDDAIIFSVSRLILDLNTHEHIGVIRVDSTNSDLKNILDKMSISKNSHLVLTDPENNVIYSQSPIGTDLLEQLSKGYGILRSNRDTFLQQSQLIRDSSWRLNYLSSQNDARSLAIVFYLGIAGAVGFFLLAAFLIYYKSSNYLVKSIDKILHVMKMVEKGCLDQHVEVKGKDELSVIGAALNTMIDELNTHIKNEYIATLEQKKSEYYALQSQINPHFIYNILSALVSLNQIGDRVTLNMMVRHLAKLLRYSCNQTDMSDVGTECAILHEYLELQKFRFESRLSYSFNVSDTAKNVAIPKFLLQPLVENSIRHGMEPYDISIRIRIDASVVAASPSQAPELAISVVDNGVGFDTMQLSVNGPNGIGLNNVKNRLLLYNSKAQFLIESSKENGTSIFISLPVETATQN